MLGFTAALAMPLAGKDDGRLTMATKACSDWETDKTMYSLDNCCDVPCCDGYSAKGISKTTLQCLPDDWGTDYKAICDCPDKKQRKKEKAADEEAPMQSNGMASYCANIDFEHSNMTKFTFGGGELRDRMCCTKEGDMLSCPTRDENGPVRVCQAPLKPCRCLGAHPLPSFCCRRR